jgi:hypothetical protein
MANQLSDTFRHRVRELTDFRLAMQNSDRVHSLISFD